MKLKIGSMSFQELLKLAETDETYAKMKVKVVVEALPGFGKKTAEAFLDKLGISLTRRVKGLGTKQKEELVKELAKK